MKPDLFERLKARLRRAPAPLTATSAPLSAEPVVPPPAPAPLEVPIDRVAILSAQFPREFPIAEAVVDRVLAAVEGVDLGPLARHSPGLKGYGWANYLRCSVARVARVQRALLEHVPAGGRVLDFGSYFGNFSLACRELGYAVDAIDGYREYGASFETCVALQRAAGIDVLDFADTGYALADTGRRYQAVICAGVIEHIPHTPRGLLETIASVLEPGGILILDTPNLAYLYRRLALLDGQSVFPPIEGQFYTELPFEGHHREFTVAEVEWMLRAIGHQVVSLETFNYSVFGQSLLTGDSAAYHFDMEADPLLREIIMTVSRQAHD